MLIHSVIEVDDNLKIDNRLESETKFRYQDENGVTASKIVSGYIEPYDPIVNGQCSVTKLEVKDNDVIICKFDPNQVTDLSIGHIHKVLREEFHGHKVLLMANDLDLMSDNPDEAINMLERMIAHIKIARQ